MIQLFRGPDLQFDIRMDGAMQLHMHKQQSTTINLLTTQHTTVIRNDEQFHCDKEKNIQIFYFMRIISITARKRLLFMFGKFHQNVT